MRTLLIVAFSLLCSTSYAQTGPKLSFQRCYGGSKNDIIRDVITLPNGDFIFAGESFSNDGDVTGHHGSTDTLDAWVMRTTRSGSIVWQRSIGGTGTDKFNAIIRGRNDTIYFVGQSLSNNGDVTNRQPNQSSWIVKMTTNGVLISSKCYIGMEFIDGVLTSRGLAVTGPTGNYSIYPGYNGGISDAFVAMIGFDDQINWFRYYGADNKDLSSDITEGPGGELWVFTHQTIPAFYDAVIYTLDPSNGKILSKYTPNARFSEGATLINNNGVVSFSVQGSDAYPSCADGIGAIGSYPGTGQEGVAVKTPFRCINMEMQYNSRFSPAHGIDGIATGKVVGVGIMNDNGTGPTKGTKGSSDAFIGILRGTSYNFTNYGGSNIDVFNAVKTLPSGTDFVAAGYTLSNDIDVSGNHGGSDGWLAVFESANLITGKVFIDQNNNGLPDPSESPFTQAIVTTKNNSGFNISASPVIGTYFINVDTGKFATSIQLTNPYYTSGTVEKVSLFNTYRNTDTVHFPIRPISGKRDYAVAAFVLSPARPGFDNFLVLHCINQGTDTMVNGKLRMIKSSRTRYISSVPGPSSVKADTLSWIIPILKPSEKTTFSIKLKTAEIPEVSLNDTLTYQILVDSAGDISSANNYTLARQIVSGSYDPNDKQESHAGFITLSELSGGEKLNYTIRFQNTGNDTAFNVTIRDTLSSKIDPSSIQMIASSHPFQLNTEKNNILVWKFTDILLPDSSDNEPASNGFITFSVQAKTGVKLGDTIVNRAAIYFDYNPPIFTNGHLTFIVPAAPPVPSLTGLDATYCGKQTSALVKITNLPNTTSGTVATATLDSRSVNIAADSTLSLTIAQLDPGNHTLEVKYSNVLSTQVNKNIFNVLKVDTPNVSLTSSQTTITDLTTPVELTAVNIGGGGSTPVFIFARNREITDILQAASTNNRLSLNPASLSVGSNWIYVKMNSGSQCTAFPSDIDSIRLERSTVTGIVDPDNPGQLIVMFPNPFQESISIKGLIPVKRYRLSISNAQGQTVFEKVLSGNSQASIRPSGLVKGLYLVRLFDIRKEKMIGSGTLVKQ